MDHQRHAAAVTDEAVGDEMARDIARALAVDPSPEFLARVRTQIANEPSPEMWRWAFALRWPVAVAALTLAIAAVFLNRPTAPIAGAALVSHAITNGAATLPYVASAFRRTSSGPAKAGRHVLRAIGPGPTPLFDPRETQALRALIAGVRTNRVDLSPLLRPGGPAPMELPPVDDLVIAPLAIEPLPLIDGAQGERQ